MKYLIIAWCFSILNAKADQEANAIVANTADAITTAVALSQGATELNPLGPAGVLIAKPVVYSIIKNQPKEEQEKYFSAAAAAGWFGTGNNLCVLARGGAGCLLVGIISSIVSWQSSSLEREYWEMCKRVIHKAPGDEC